MPERVQPVAFGPVQEHDGLLDGPDRDRLAGAVPFPGLGLRGGPHHSVRPACRRELEAAGGVVGEQALADRGVQRGPQRRANLVQRRGGERIPVAVSPGPEPGEGGGQLAELEPVEPDLSEFGDQVLLAVLGVAAPRGRPDRGSGRQPVPQPLRNGPGAGGAHLRRLTEEFHASGPRCDCGAEPTAADLPGPPVRTGIRQSECQLPCPRSDNRPHDRLRCHAASPQAHALNTTVCLAILTPPRSVGFSVRRMKRSERFTG
ncbi:hypothetical protein GCM10009539_22710 [Cryptosporangium japonicum]|uniref:Uncharacterized protein n=1 Tax=Cryptosporangium japonicum TaxID=80872 RepID=A0ABN0U2Z3_9ACTN